MRFGLNQPGCPCPANNPVVKRLAKKLGENRNDVAAQHSANFKDDYKSSKPSGGSIKILFPAISTSRTIDATIGTNVSRCSSFSTTSNSTPPVLITSRT